jgi:type I restriction enzyme S subunit
MSAQSGLVQRLGAIDALGAAIERAQRRGAALRRLILERAFSGELVPQDPSDEPASALFDRIRAARAARPVPAGRRRKSQ